MKISKGIKRTAIIFTVMLITSIVTAMAAFADSNGTSAAGKWVTGDFHTHTYLTDGSHTEEEVLSNAFGKYNLDWMANAEHGGTSKNTPFGVKLDNPVWRWTTLPQSYTVLSYLSWKYPNNTLIQGLEWNVPSHEHASVGIIANSAAPISNFEYVFDGGDKDTSRTLDGLPKINSTHADAVAGAKYLEDAYKNTSYFILNHPSRALTFTASSIRDFNNAAPDVAFGMEGIPGHQKEATRGGYGYDKGADTYKARTYGGADYMIAKVGGLWDSLLGEGRHFWTFINSDFHDNVSGDFWPGEYAKDYTYVTGNNQQAIVDGLRSGNSFAVEGDLINSLDFKVQGNGSSATMGQTLTVNKDSSVTVTIRFKSPEKNNNGDKIAVDHVDLISGNVTEKAKPGTDAYNKDTNETTKVVATFTKKQWHLDSDGYYSVTYTDKADTAKYYRLRGTNNAPNTLNETDAAGNPLIDDLVGPNDASNAYKDLWFYSNPIFVSFK